MNWVKEFFRAVPQGCLTCQVLREQLEYERIQNKELIETITSLVKPVPIQVTTTKEYPEGMVMLPKGGTFSRKRRILEAADRQVAKLKQDSPVIAKSDEEIKGDIEKLEDEVELFKEVAAI